MATQLQLRKGTKIQNDAFTGAEAELTYDSTSKGLRLHDGVKQGGYMVDTVVAWQAPTAENNYTWYRKYASGWVEQGGLTSDASGDGTVTLPVTMADTDYFISATNEQTTSENAWGWVYVAKETKTTTGFGLCSRAANGTAIYLRARWEVKGMCAQ